MSNKFKDHYKVLGVARDADVREIKSAYRKLVKLYHPDHTSNKLSKSEISFTDIQEAYEILCSKVQRQKYDQELMQQEVIQDGQVFFDISFYRDSPVEPENMEWMDNFFSPNFLPPHQLDEDLNIILSKDETQNGGMISVDLPAYFGLGFGFSFNPRRRFNLRIPRGVKNGDIKDIYVPELDFWIRVCFTVR